MKHKMLTCESILASWPKSISPSSDICIGLSGGVDSVVLLHLLKQINPPIKLSAIHVNHGISPNAQTWTDFCQRFCENLNVPLQIKYITLNKNGGESLENLARRARIDAFLNSKHQVIALAHHQNDQVETILSQIFRGSDLHNIAAMQLVTTRQDKIFWRPLLEFSRSQIETYASTFNLEYITDESNLDTKYLRNFVRHDILPLLQNWDSNVTTKVLNFNEQLQNILSITDEVGQNDLQNSSLNNTEINVEYLASLSPVRQTNLLSKFIKLNNLPLPSHKQLIEFAKQATTSNWDRKPQLKLNEQIILVKYQNKISLECI